VVVLPRATSHQGLTLVHFSPPSEPFLSLTSTETTQRLPQKVLTSSRKVDEFKPLPDGITRDIHVVDDVAHAMHAAAMPARDEVAAAAARLTFEDTVRKSIDLFHPNLSKVEEEESEEVEEVELKQILPAIATTRSRFEPSCNDS